MPPKSGARFWDKDMHEIKKLTRMKRIWKIATRVSSAEVQRTTRTTVRLDRRGSSHAMVRALTATQPCVGV